MAKATITRIFVASAIAAVAGAVLALVALLIAFGDGAFVMRGHDVVGIAWTPLAAGALGLGILGVLVIMAGCIGGLVSWIGALLNTVQLEDKAWFIVLLLLGLFSFGLVAMIAYVIAGPDGQDHGRPVRGASSLA